MESGRTEIEGGEYCLIKQRDGFCVVARIVRDGKRYAWIEYPTGMEVREVRRRTMWRFPTHEAAEAMRDELQAARDGRASARKCA